MIDGVVSGGWKIKRVFDDDGLFAGRVVVEKGEKIVDTKSLEKWNKVPN